MIEIANPVAIVRELLQRAGYAIDTPSFELAERTLLSLDDAAIARRIYSPSDFGVLLGEIGREVQATRRALCIDHYRRYQSHAESMRAIAFSFPAGSVIARNVWLALSAAAISISVRDPFEVYDRGGRRQ